MRQSRPWNSDFRPFDDEAQAALLDLISTREARSVAEACRVLRLSSATVYRWISRGKRERYTVDTWVYRDFYLRLQLTKAGTEPAP